MRVIWYLLPIYVAFNITLSVVESDSLNVIRMINDELPNQWKCSKWCKMIQRHVLFTSITFSYSLCESNYVVDFLAKLGSPTCEDSLYHSFEEIP